MATTGTRGRSNQTRQGAAQPTQAKQTNQGSDGRGRVTDPATDGRIGNVTNTGGQNGNEQSNGDLAETLGGEQGGAAVAQQAQTAPAQTQATQQAAQPAQGQDARMFFANQIMEAGIAQLALAAILFREIDVAGGQADQGIQTAEYVDGCYDGLQGVIAEKFDELAKQGQQS